MRVSDSDGVRRITFDRPDVRNAMTPGIAAELADAVEAVGPDDHHAVVLTGEGEAFSAGGDLEAMAGREETAEEAFARTTETFGRAAEAMLGAPVPIVAEVGGDAVGAGLSLVAASDFAFAAASARFSAAFVRVGLVPDTGGTFLLPRLVGLRAAKEIAFTGRFVDAREAADLGLVNEVVSDGELSGVVADCVDRLRERPTRTIGLTKRAIHGSLGGGWREAIDYETHVQALAYSTPEHAEGVEAFLEGRDPEFD